jgi:hypothetical protein
MARSGGPLEPPSSGRWEVGLAWPWRRLRDGLQYQSMHHPTDVLTSAQLGTGWLVVTVGGIHLGIGHHELRAVTPRENPARWWPPPRHG